MDLLIIFLLCLSPSILVIVLTILLFPAIKRIERKVHESKASNRSR
jgi:hypothetical protein